MPYKPKYCCQCGGKIDRISWKPWNSRRFCELCETEYIINDRLRQVVFGIALLFGLFGIGSIFQKPEKQLNFAPSQFASGMPNTKNEVSNLQSAPRTATQPDVQLPAQTNNFNVQTKSQVIPVRSELKKNQVEIPSDDPSETVYFCGAQTKKGNLCSRRVKGGGRCWQHEGQAAMLPQAKLIASK